MVRGPSGDDIHVYTTPLHSHAHMWMHNLLDVIQLHVWQSSVEIY